MINKDAYDPYVVLGVSRHDSAQEIRRVHKRLLSRHHPDRFVGSPAEVIEEAERTVRDINEAFAAIQRQRSVGAR